MFKPTKGQSIAIKNVMNFVSYAESGDTFILAGHAGVGKTALIAMLIKMLKYQVTICAPTHGACKVLTRKLNDINADSEIDIHAITIHSLIYRNPLDHEKALLNNFKQANLCGNTELQNSIESELKGLSETLSFTEQTSWVKNTKLVICDEASMVTVEMVDIFKKLGCIVIFVGDGGQLPPPRKKAGVDFDKADYTLTEIVRTEVGNPIPIVAEYIRKFGRYVVNSTIVKAKELQPSVFVDKPHPSAQILVWTNDRRRIKNAELSPFGHKLVEKQHYIIKTTNTKQDLFAGDDIFIEKIKSIKGKKFQKGRYSLDVIVNGSEHRTIRANSSDIDLSLSDMDKLFAAKYGAIIALPYAITVHNSQGNEFDHVHIIPDGIHNFNSDATKWFYTALTRAKKTVFVEL